MSRRSYNSYAHEKRISKYRVTDEELYNYSLKVALLSHLMQPRAESKVSASDAREREHSSRLSNLANFSLSDMFKDIRDGHKSVKFPEKLLKVLEQKLQAIAMGKDPNYSDQLVRRTMARFYGQFSDDSFKRQMKENRKIEELILMFATHATTVLKKEPTLAGDAWKFELNRQLGFFVRILGESLRSLTYVSPELMSRLDMYTEKLAPAQSWRSDSGYDSASSRDSFSGPSLSFNVADMQMVCTVTGLFKVSQKTAQQEVDQLRATVNEKAAFNDLKTCLKNINSGAAFPGRKEDFTSDAAWQNWRLLETTHLQQLVMVMNKLNPELARSGQNDGGYSGSGGVGGRPASAYNRASYYEVDSNGSYDPLAGDDDDGNHNFTYIPPNPKRFYKRLLEHCLVSDLEKMMSPDVDDNEEVSLGILSQPHIDVLNECALRWRIGHPYRVTCFLELVKQFYERQDVPLEVVPEAIQNVTKILNEVEFESWPIPDAEYLLSVLGSLFNVFLSAVYHAMDAIPNVKPSSIESFIVIITQLRETGLLERTDLDIIARLGDVEDRVRQVAAEWYEKKMNELQAAPGVNKALPLLLMTDEIERVAKLLDKRYPKPLLGKIDLVSLVIDVAVPHFITDLTNAQRRLYEASNSGPIPDVPVQDIFSLYRRTKVILKMFAAFCPDKELVYALGPFFEPYVRQWLVTTDNTTSQWVENAIAADKFESEGAEGHSSSIVDLFDSLRSPINFLQDLEWDDDYQQARFATGLARTISKAIEQYCRSVESLFLAEMYPRPSDYIQPQKSSAWLEKARQLTAAGEKRVEPFNFLPQSCVKLNNVEAARKLLDQLYNQIQADMMAEILAKAPPVPEKTDRGDKFLFSVKVAMAEDLVPLDSSPSANLDTFVTLSDEAGNRLAKTRTIYESLDPRWDETFDISVEKPLWLMVGIRDRALVGKHDTVGRAYLCLDPRRFSDFLAHDQWMDLDTQGRILLRLSMEGEKDDIQFYFGRAFRSLKRAESDMLRIFIDKMLPFIQQCLSRSILKTLIKPGGGLGYNKALGGVTALYRSALGTSVNNDPQIPLPQSEKPRVRPEELTDVEIEQAILPLFDYFDANLQTLNTYLSDTAKEMVMSRVWKEILNVIEALLVPPLSHLESDMKPLSDKEVDIVFKWLKFLRDYFYAGGEGPVPLESLQNQKYRDVVSIRLYYDWHSDALMEECVRMMQNSLRSAPTMKRVKSVYSQRNLGTIRERKQEKKQEKEVPNGEVILKILRMRPGTSDFIQQQLQIISQMQAELENQAKEAEKRKAHRQQQRSLAQIPEVPPLPVQ